MINCQDILPSSSLTVSHSPRTDEMNKYLTRGEGSKQEERLSTSGCWFMWGNNFASPSLDGGHWNKRFFCKQDSVLKEIAEIFEGLEMYFLVFHASVPGEKVSK